MNALPFSKRIFLTTLVVVVFFVLVFLFSPYLGAAIYAFGGVVATFAGFMFGPRGGLVMGLLMFPAILVFQHFSSGDNNLGQPLVASFAFTICGYAIGRFSELQQRLKKELADHINTQRQLVEHQSQLMTAAKFSALGEMAGGIAHEINSPLTAILMRAQQMQVLLNRSPIDENQLRHCCKSVELMSIRISKIINGMKKFSRVSDSNQPFESIPLASILDDSFALCAEKFRNTGIQMQFNLPDEKILISCRAVEISQVILNILNNAADATEGQSDRKILVSVTQKPNSVEIRIADNGPGIKKEVAEKLFEPFFTTKPVGKGTGLGLSISMGLIKGHKGQLRLDTSSSQTCFVIELPRAV